ncbi:hypothetical protein J1D01_08395 [Seonamhaeicola sp. NFXS20]|uniref:hypothetical protein n=1 Tax=Seonamhaeicola sp. NFXS20 TaxID=2816959 RepID=UPI003B8B5006
MLFDDSAGKTALSYSAGQDLKPMRGLGFSVERIGFKFCTKLASRLASGARVVQKADFCQRWFVAMFAAKLRLFVIFFTQKGGA